MERSADLPHQPGSPRRWLWALLLVVGSVACCHRTAGSEATPADGDEVDSFTCGDEVCSDDEYCSSILPGFCHGAPVPSGGCPPGCRPTRCPGGERVCLCPRRSCVALPDGCASCSCLKLARSCSCQADERGRIRVECAAP